MIIPNEMTRGQKFLHYTKISVVHILIFSAIAGVAFGMFQKQSAQKQIVLLQDKIDMLTAKPSATSTPVVEKK